ncbi:hypothetical protein [Rhizobium sp. C4]|uniref:hypothetical protein n=1 Tax=Rhizobium sp. C4 TaxID=1349800 RepID=UPI001E33AFBF|nr:hypothetical protein [Rhizobium sp. C4]MCD2176038.1 hypothetical protein [Rhizobium sp. C4]
MARRRKKIMPEIMRYEPIKPVAVAPDTIEFMLTHRSFYHQAATALGFSLHCHRHRCRRQHACVTFALHADHSAEPIKLYPACIRNADAARLIQSSLEAIEAATGEVGENVFDPVFRRAFLTACDTFRRARIEAARAEKEAAADAERRRLLRETRK